jgi:replicative DNA helicase
VEGNRNHTATKLAGHLLAKGLPEDEAWAMLKMWNSDKNNPSLDESELCKTFDSVAKLDSRNQKQDKKINVAEFLDSTKKVVYEYSENYNKIPFAGGNLKQLETRMNGGLIGGRLYILGGIPSASKTMVANILADNICLNGQPVIFFSYDDGRSELRNRTFARFSAHEIEDFNQNRLSENEIKSICEATGIKKIAGVKYISENMINIEKWGDLIEQIKKRHDKAPVVIIDYLRKLRSENKTSDERLRVDDILSNLTNLAKKYNIPVLAISELARDSYKSGQRLSMASFKESGTIEYEASWLGILAAVEETEGGFKLKNNWEKIIEQDGNVDLIVFKAKRGTGITGKIPLKVDKNKMTVKDRINENKYDNVTPLKGDSVYE